MAKYSFDFKKKVVMSYLSGEGGYAYLANKYNIPAKSKVKLWVYNYNTFGDEGLLRSRQTKKYTFEYKLHVVELYLSSEVSYQELALQEGIYNPAMLVKWVNDFRIAGPDALRPKKKGRKKSLDPEKKKITPDFTISSGPCGSYPSTLVSSARLGLMNAGFAASAAFR